MKNSNKIVSSLLSEISEESELEKAHQSSLEFFYHQRKRYPYRSWIEIDINGIRSSHQINRNWSPALRICHYVDKNPNLQQNTWILCLETASQMMSTLWGMAARHLDCHPWHLHQGASLTHEEFHYQLDALLSIFNEVSILTTRSIKNRYSLDSRKELSVVLIDEIPLPADFNHDLLTNKNDVGNIYLKSSGTSGKESMAVLSRTSLRNRLPSKIPSTLATKTLQWL